MLGSASSQPLEPYLYTSFISCPSVLVYPLFTVAVFVDRYTTFNVYQLLFHSHLLSVHENQNKDVVMYRFIAIGV